MHKIEFLDFCNRKEALDSKIAQFVVDGLSQQLNYSAHMGITEKDLNLSHPRKQSK